MILFFASGIWCSTVLAAEYHMVPQEVSVFLLARQLQQPNVLFRVFFFWRSDWPHSWIIPIPKSWAQNVLATQELKWRPGFQRLHLNWVFWSKALARRKNLLVWEWFWAVFGSIFSPKNTCSHFHALCFVNSLLTKLYLDPPK